jgi:hypothetical protein
MWPRHRLTRSPPTRSPPLAAKQDRMRQAKAEAEKEISAYRMEREGAYQKKVAEVRDDGDDAVGRSPLWNAPMAPSGPHMPMSAIQRVRRGAGVAF